MHHPITLVNQLGSLAIQRVENGWIIHTYSRYGSRGEETPLSVAETPAALSLMIHEWATAQVQEKSE